MFTRNQIEEIKKKLVAFGTKDTQLLDARKLDGNEIVAIVQDGENRKIPLSAIIGLLSDINVTPNDDFTNVSKDTTEIITLNTAVSKVVINNRKLGQIITFKDSANSWAIRQFTGDSLDNWNDISLWKSISGIDELKSQVETNTEDISVLSDEIERHDASILNLNTDVSKLKDKDIAISSSLSGLTTRVDTNTASISENKTAIEKNTSDIKNVSDTVNAHAARLDDVDTTLENALFKNKGYFTTVEKLNEAIPNPTIGSKAYVGTSEPYAIYIVENGAWVDSGHTGGDEIVAKITTDRIEDGAVTSEKIATSAFDSTLSVSGKIAPAAVVAEKLSKLGSYVKNKSNIAFINSSANNIIVEGNKITFKPGIDIYGDRYFFRLAEEQIIEEVYQGSGYIGFNTESNKFFASGSIQNINEKTLIVGINDFNNITLYATSYKYNNTVKGFYYSQSAGEDFDKSKSSSPVSHTNLHRAFYKCAISAPRGGVTLDGNTVKLVANYYFFYNPIDGSLKSKYLTEEQSFTLTPSLPVLVYNITTEEFSLKQESDITIFDIVCLFYDGTIGLCGGVWYSYVLENKIKSYVSVRTSGALIGAVNVSADGVVKVIEKVDVYYGIGGKFKRFSDGTELFTITGTGTNVVCFNPTDLTLTYGEVTGGIIIGVCEGKFFYPIGNVPVIYSDGTEQKTNIQLTANLKLLEKTAGGAIFARGIVSVSSDGIVSAKTDVDVYYGIGGKFKRFSDGTELFTITGTGTNVVCFNPTDLTLTYGEVTDGIIIGTTNGKNFSPLGNLIVENADSTSCYDNYTLSKKIDSIELSDIPKFVAIESLSTYKRVVNYLTSESSYLLGHITDVHSGGTERYKHIGYLNDINKTWQFNVLCNAGDIGLDGKETEEENAAVELMYNTKSQMNCTSPWLYCKGNHERLRTMSELGNVFMKPMRRQFPDIVFGDNNGLYGYIDDKNSKVRTIYLNTSDTDSQVHYAISDEQVVWLGNTLLSTNDDYKIVILTHLCPKQIGEWISYPGDWRTASNLVKVIEGFAQRQIISHSDTSFDYTNKLAKIVCVLSGDSHFNNSTKENGVNYVVRQGYGSSSEEDTSEGATFDRFSWTSQCLFDVLAIKDNSNAKIFRIGAGGESRDLELTF